MDGDGTGLGAGSTQLTQPVHDPPEKYVPYLYLCACASSSCPQVSPELMSAYVYSPKRTTSQRTPERRILTQDQAGSLCSAWKSWPLSEFILFYAM